MPARRKLLQGILTHSFLSRSLQQMRLPQECWAATGHPVGARLAFDKVLALGDWVHADSFRPATGNRHRCTWYSAVHKQWYDLDWILVPKRHLLRVASMTLRHVTDPLQTQCSKVPPRARCPRSCSPGCDTSSLASVAW